MIRKFIGYYKPHRKLFFIDMLCAFIVALCDLFYPVIAKDIINEYVPSQNLRLLLVWAGVLLGIYALKALLNYIIQYWGHVVGVRMQGDMRRDMFRRLQKLPFSFYDENKTGAVMSRLINDLFDVSELAHHGPEDLFLSAIMLVGSFVMLATIDVWLTLIVFAFLPFIVLFAVKTRKEMNRAFKKAREEIAEINAGLNRAADYMRQKDNTRAEWIRGVSHDIRTPLSMVLGYASELEDDGNLPPDARKQAGIIRRESEKMKRLIDDLNLTTKLEYALQPVRRETVDLVEIGRQAVSEVLNGGLPDRYELEFSGERPGCTACMEGDAALLRRMLDNLIRNSIVHNPQGCHISVMIGAEEERCTCMVTDNGVGIDAARLEALNREADVSSTQGGEHGLGLKLVRQIVKAHGGTVRFRHAVPQGLEVSISFSENASGKHI